MTDQELANQIFPQEHHGSSTSASLLTGTALAASSDGRVLILVDGATGGSVDAGVLLPTTLSVAAGENVIITLYGLDGHGKKAIVTGKVGESSGGGDISALEHRVSVLEGEASSLIAQLDGLYLDIISSTDSSEWTVGSWATRSCYVQAVIIHNGTSGIMIGSFAAQSNSATGTSVWQTLRLGTFTHWRGTSVPNEPYSPVKVVNNAWANAAAVTRLNGSGVLYWTFWAGVSGNLPAGEKVTGTFSFPVTKR